MDCGSQRSFTCSVTSVLAGWTISGLSGISITRNNGQSAADNHTRITTTNSGNLSSSTITITGFSTADNGGTIQCINLADNNVQGMASILVGELYRMSYKGSAMLLNNYLLRGWLVYQ